MTRSEVVVDDIVDRGVELDHVEPADARRECGEDVSTTSASDDEISAVPAELIADALWPGPQVSPVGQRSVAVVERDRGVHPVVEQQSQGTS